MTSFLSSEVRITRHNMIIPLWRVLLSYVITFLLFHYHFPSQKDRKDSLRCCLLVEVDYLHYE